MIFSSAIFLFYFFPVVLLLYYGCRFSRTLQNIILMVASLFFYAWGEPVFVLLMIASILVNTALGYAVEKTRGSWKNTILALAVVLNLGTLFIFKYMAFLLDTLGVFSAGILQPFSLALPLGISFFTFQALSYVVDIYRGEAKAANPFTVGLYISFFPQLIAGPIVTYNTVEDQIYHRKETFDKFAVGCCRFCAGLVKKVLLSNCFGILADKIFGWSAVGTDLYSVPALTAWLGAIAYALQIYYDFSAYSDMAIGLGLCFGFKFKENFNFPYIATSVTDFWKRWHISLTDWFRDYIYIPLGGNRNANQDKTVRNLFIVWLFTGIWHGANWTFIIWGLIYFFFQLLERFTGLDKKLKNKWYGHLYALFIINLCWVIFRADNLYQAGIFIKNMFMLNRNGLADSLTWFLFRENFVQLTAGILFAMPLTRLVNRKLHQLGEALETNGAVSGKARMAAGALNLAYPVVLGVLVLVSISYLVIGSYNPFIYFNF